MSRLPRSARVVLIVCLVAPWLALLGIMAGRPYVLAAGTITIDGQFADWSGQPSIADPLNDCHKSDLDITTFAFTSSHTLATSYFMAKRQTRKNGPMGYILKLDTNNDGDYTDSTDRLVQVRYDNLPTSSQVDVSISTGAGAFIATIATGQDWGESAAEGGLRVEWPVTYAQLGIAPGQVIRMVLSSRPGNSNQANSICDTTDEVQWSPADALGYPLVAVLVGGALVSVAHQQRRRRACPTGC
ncbi:MAG: hypothetical protein IT340_04415 [Chloroflexi bacterium]|nr:hypothetical protein [Chloroflexota bacterium]